MIRVLLAGCFVALLSSLAPAEDKRPETKEKKEIEKGKILDRSYTFKEADNKEMKYTLYVPTKYDAKKSSPLVVALHGLFSNPRQVIRYPNFVKTAEKHGYLVVAPMGYNSRGWYGSRGKRGGFGRDPKNLGELSEKDVMNVIAIVRKEFNIDKNRIYCYGHSMGGGGTWHIAMQNPNLFAALAPMAQAGPRSSANLHKIKHVPAIIVQGDRDGLVRGTRRWVEKLKELKIEHKYIEVKGGNHVTPAWSYFPEIFEFFDKHPRKTAKKPAAKEPAEK